MPSAGPDYAGSASNDGGIGTEAWSGPSNATGTADDTPECSR